LPLGRRPLPRGVLSFYDPGLLLPAEILLDTSFVFHALDRRQSYHQAATDFLARLSEARAILIMSELLQVELAEVAYRVALQERFKGKWQGHRRHGLKSYDAVHAAIAITAEVKAIAACDVDFGSVPTKTFAIHTDPSRVRSCRQRRGGR
jgi:predicted nucleic acid-binding protein